MPMLAELIDAVVGADTHRDTHELEIAHPSGASIARCSIPNTSRGFTELVGWIAEHAPGPRVVVAVEGTRSYGAALTRALTEAGLTVIECEQPTRAARRGKGKSDAIDAHLAVLHALQLEADRLPTPRADGDREALRTLLTARDELTGTGTAQTNRLKALLLSGDDTDRALARGKLTDADLNTLARRCSFAVFGMVTLDYRRRCVDRNTRIGTDGGIAGAGVPSSMRMEVHTSNAAEGITTDTGRTVPRVRGR